MAESDPKRPRPDSTVNPDLPEVRLDGGRHPRGKIGYVLLATEQTVQDDVIRLTPPGVGVHFTRVRNADSITVESLTDVADDLARAASVVLPDGSLDVITYACTSGSLVLGEERVFELLNQGAPGAKATSLITGVIRALRAVAAKRVVVCTPYVDAVNRMEVDYLEARGFEVAGIYGLGLEFDSEMVRVPPDFLAEYAAAASAKHPEADALFFSCGAMRSIDMVDALERRLGKPVIVSNQAMVWDCLRLIGVEDRIEGFGSLFRDH